MKKDYVSPMLSILQIENQTSVMTASDRVHTIEGLDDLDVSSQQWEGGAALGRRSNSLWDDDEE